MQSRPTNMQLAAHTNHKIIQIEHIKASKHLNLANLNLRVSVYERTTTNDHPKQLGNSLSYQ